MHRNTLLLTALLAVIAALVVGVNVGRNIASKTETVPLPTPSVTPTTMLGYTNDTCGVSLLYPSNLTVRDNIATTTAFMDSVHPDQTIVLACEKDIPRAALPPDKIETITIQSASSSATISARLYHTTHAQNGSPLDELIFTHTKRGFDVYVGGYGETFQKIIASLKLL